MFSWFRVISPSCSHRAAPPLEWDRLLPLLLASWHRPSLLFQSPDFRICELSGSFDRFINGLTRYPLVWTAEKRTTPNLQQLRVTGESPELVFLAEWAGLVVNCAHMHVVNLSWLPLKYAQLCRPWWGHADIFSPVASELQLFVVQTDWKLLPWVLWRAPWSTFKRLFLNYFFSLRTPQIPPSSGSHTHMSYVPLPLISLHRLSVNPQ